MHPFDKPSVALFHGRHCNAEIITLCVRWYIMDKLSSRDLTERMAERHVEGAHTTIMRWVQRDVPEFAKRWQRYTRPVGTSWGAMKRTFGSKGAGCTCTVRRLGKDKPWIFS